MIAQKWIECSERLPREPWAGKIRVRSLEKSESYGLIQGWDCSCRLAIRITRLCNADLSGNRGFAVITQIEVVSKFSEDRIIRRLSFLRHVGKVAVTYAPSRPVK